MHVLLCWILMVSAGVLSRTLENQTSGESQVRTFRSRHLLTTEDNTLFTEPLWRHDVEKVRTKRDENTKPERSNALLSHFVADSHSFSTKSKSVPSQLEDKKEKKPSSFKTRKSKTLLGSTFTENEQQEKTKKSQSDKSKSGSKSEKKRTGVHKWFGHFGKTSEQENEESGEEGTPHPTFIILNSGKKKPHSYSFGSSRKLESGYSLFLPVLSQDDDEAQLEEVEISELLEDENDSPHKFEFKLLYDELPGYITRLNKKSSHSLISKLSDLVKEGIEDDDSSSSSEEDDSDEEDEDEEDEEGDEEEENEEEKEESSKWSHHGIEEKPRVASHSFFTVKAHDYSTSKSKLSAKGSSSSEKSNSAASSTRDDNTKSVSQKSLSKSVTKTDKGAQKEKKVASTIRTPAKPNHKTENKETKPKQIQRPSLASKVASPAPVSKKVASPAPVSKKVAPPAPVSKKLASPLISTSPATPINRPRQLIPIPVKSSLTSSSPVKADEPLLKNFSPNLLSQSSILSPNSAHPRVVIIPRMLLEKLQANKNALPNVNPQVIFKPLPLVQNNQPKSLLPKPSAKPLQQSPVNPLSSEKSISQNLDVQQPKLTPSQKLIAKMQAQRIVLLPNIARGSNTGLKEGSDNPSPNIPNLALSALSKGIASLRLGQPVQVHGLFSPKS